jgi:uncharacterized membrane protein HdeD (DUF308 family)
MDAALAQPDPSDKSLERHWWLFLLWGIVLVVLGVLLLAVPGLTTIVLVQLMAVYLLIHGVFQLVGAALGRYERDRALNLIAGLIGVVVGILLIANPLSGSVLFVGAQYYLLGGAALGLGLLTLVTAFTGEGGFRWGRLVLGALALLVAVYFIANPLFGILSLVWLLASVAVVAGLAMVVVALVSRLTGR